MKLIFEPTEHLYTTDGDTNTKWTSVTSLIALFHEHFDTENIAKKCSKKRKSKWYGIKPEEIIRIWDEERIRATTLGSWYHDQREQETLGCTTLRREGLDLPIVSPIMEGNCKIAPNQLLTPGIYPEHFVYLEAALVCGQADRIEVVADTVNVYDYKSNKVLEKKSYVNWEGVSKKMYHPLEHLDDCNYIHYSLQLSIYMYMVIKHNPKLKPGKIVIQHVTFEKESETEFGYPIYATDVNGDPIIKDVISYELPYLKSEVMNMFTYIKKNPEILKK